MGEGLASFQARMRAIPKGAIAAVGPALIKGGDRVADAQRLFAASSRDTGALIDSIAVTGPGRATPAYSQPGGSMTVPENAVAVTVGNSDVRYPHLVEHGTRNAPAQPFFWPGFRMAKLPAQKAIRRAMTTAIRKAMGK